MQWLTTILNFMLVAYYESLMFATTQFVLFIDE